MSLKSTLEKMKYDHRLLRMNLEKGVITQEDYKQFVNKIPDSSQKLETLGEIEEKSKNKKLQSDNLESERVPNEVNESVSLNE